VMNDVSALRFSTRACCLSFIDPLPPTFHALPPIRYTGPYDRLDLSHVAGMPGWLEP
jgi:hypothetical protein